MAENKKSFIAYCDWGAIFDELSNEEAGKLVKHLFNYVRDKNPESDKITSLIFIPIKQTLKRDLVSWGKKSEKRAEIGRKGGIASGKVRASKSKQKQANEAIGLKSKQTKQNEHVSVSVSVSGSVNDKDKEKEKEKEKEKDILFKEELELYKEDYPKELLEAFWEYWSEPDKNKKMRCEKEKTWDTSRRLKRWSKNNYGSTHEKSGKSVGASESELAELYTDEYKREQAESD